MNPNQMDTGRLRSLCYAVSLMFSALAWQQQGEGLYFNMEELQIADNEIQERPLTDNILFKIFSPFLIGEQYV